MPESDWQPPLSFDEKLKAWLVPPKLYIQYRARKEARRGEPELHLLPFLVGALIEVGLYRETGRRRCPSDIAEHNRERPEWYSFPVLADLTEEAVFDWVPL